MLAERLARIQPMAGDGVPQRGQRGQDRPIRFRPPGHGAPRSSDGALSSASRSAPGGAGRAATGGTGSRSGRAGSAAWRPPGLNSARFRCSREQTIITSTPSGVRMGWEALPGDRPASRLRSGGGFTVSSRMVPGSTGRSPPPLPRAACSTASQLRAPAASFCAFSTWSRCCCVGLLGSSVPAKAKKAWRMVIMVAMSRPVSRRCRSATIWKPPGTRMALLMAPGGMRSSTAATSGSTSSLRTQPRSPPCSAVCAWLNWVAAMAKGVPRRSWPTTSSTKRRTSASAPGSSSGMKISETRNSGWPARALALRTASCDLGLGGVGIRAELLADQPGPADLGADLVVQHARRHADLGELQLERAGGEVVALLQLADRIRHVGIGHRQAAAPHLLQAQALIDQQAGDLRRQAVQRLRRHGDAGIQGKQPGAADDVGAAHHFLIDHRDDAVGLGVGRDWGGGRRLRRLREGRAGQQRGQGQRMRQGAARPDRGVRGGGCMASLSTRRRAEGPPLPLRVSPSLNQASKAAKVAAAAASISARRPGRRRRLPALAAGPPHRRMRLAMAEQEAPPGLRARRQQPVQRPGELPAAEGRAFGHIKAAERPGGGAERRQGAGRVPGGGARRGGAGRRRAPGGRPRSARPGGARRYRCPRARGRGSRPAPLPPRGGSRACRCSSAT